MARCVLQCNINTKLIGLPTSGHRKFTFDLQALAWIRSRREGQQDMHWPNVADTALHALPSRGEARSPRRSFHETVKRTKTLNQMRYCRHADHNNDNHK